MMRLLGWVTGLLTVVLAAVWLSWSLLRADIGMTLFERQVKAVAGTDQSAGLPNGLHVYLCGTGSPIPDPSRAGPCVGILAGKSAFIFDTGSGSVRNLAGMGFPVGRTRKAFFTHLHSDHIDGFGELLLQAWIGGNRTTPLPVGGPAGTGDVIGGFVTAYSLDAAYRTAHHGEEIASSQGFGAVAEEIAFADGKRHTVVHEAGGVTITAFLVDHEPVSPALGYRIDYAGRSVTISGDTVSNDSVVLMARETDLLIHEALNRDMVLLMADAAKGNGNNALAKVFADIQDYHASPEDAADIAERAGAGMLVLTHIVPPVPNRFLNAAFLGEARNSYSGRIVVGEDGMLISLPVNVDNVSIRKQLD